MLLFAHTVLQSFCFYQGNTVVSTHYAMVEASTSAQTPGSGQTSLTEEKAVSKSTTDKLTDTTDRCFYIFHINNSIIIISSLLTQWFLSPFL